MSVSNSIQSKSVDYRIKLNAGIPREITIRNVVRILVSCKSQIIYLYDGDITYSYHMDEVESVESV